MYLASVPRTLLIVWRHIMLQYLHVTPPNTAAFSNGRANGLPSERETGRNRIWLDPNFLPKLSGRVLGTANQSHFTTTNLYTEISGEAIP